MNIVTENGVQYAEMYCPSVAEAVGLAPKGSSKLLRFSVTGYRKGPDGSMVPQLEIGMMSNEKHRKMALRLREKRIHEIMDGQGVGREEAEHALQEMIRKL